MLNLFKHLGYFIEQRYHEWVEMLRQAQRDERTLHSVAD
jgi:hypothetical protein